MPSTASSTRRGALRIPKIEFSTAAVQVLFAAMLIDAFHAALENRIIALNSIS